MATKTKFLLYAVLIAALIPLSIWIYRQYTLKQAQKNVGTIEINALVYEDADSGISNIYPLNISKMYYMGNLLLEEITENDTIKYCLFNRTSSTDYTPNLENISSLKNKSIKNKKFGALPLSENIPNYKDRIIMNDTVLNDVLYKRFAVKNPSEYSVFYIQENLNIPYSFNKIAEADYKGTITRIDSYKLKEDIFIDQKNSMGAITGHNACRKENTKKILQYIN